MMIEIVINGEKRSVPEHSTVRSLLEELGVEAAPTKSSSRSAREQRIIAGFEEIERFEEEHGRAAAG